MNLFELLFFIAAIVCAIIGASFFGQFGIAAGIGGCVAGLSIPYITGQILCWTADLRFSRTREGRRRTIAEGEFDKTHEDRRITSWRGRPSKGRDGSFIVTIYYGETRPPLRAFYRFCGNSMEPQEITGEDAQNYIDVPLMR